MSKRQLSMLIPSAISIALLSACSDRDETGPVQSVTQASLLEGVWSASAYGQLYQFGRTNTGYSSAKFHITAESCVPGEALVGLTAADLDAVTRLTEDPNKIEIHDEGEVVAPGVEHQRLESLPELCAESLLLIKGDPGYVFDPQQDFRIFWNTFNELYFDFALSGTDWQAIRNAAEPQLAAIETEEELFQLFIEMITPLGDGHNELLLGDLSNGVFELLDSESEFETFAVSHKPDHIGILLSRYASNAGLTLPLNDTDQGEFETFLETWEHEIEGAILGYASSAVETAADDNFIWFITDDNIGYLFVGAMAGYGDSDFDIVADTALAKETLERIVEDMQDTNGMIIDVRFNEGGEDEVSLAIASYFFADTTHLYSKQARLSNDRTELVEVFVEPAGDSQYLAPVVLLTSSTTGSAAEIFTLSMRNLSNVAIVGEPTAGRFSNQLVNRVSADIAYSLSNEFYYSPSGEWFERAGVPVDEAVPFVAQALLAEGRDPGIEKAIELLSP